MITAYFFPGEIREVALVIAGVHGKELSGIEVAHWLRVKLQARLEKEQKRPHFTTIIVPELFPESAELARKCRDKKQKDKEKDLAKRCDLSQNGREVVRTTGGGTKFTVYPNRQFPPPGQPLSSLEEQKPEGPIYPDGRRIKLYTERGGESVPAPLLEGTRELLQLIELVKPVRIATVHAHLSALAKKGKDAPGIFVDPRYEYDKATCQVDVLAPKNLPAPSDPDPEKKRDQIASQTNSCKFDVITDPAFPAVGFFQFLNNALAGKSENDPGVKKARGHMDDARRYYREEVKADNETQWQNAHQKLVALFDQAAKELDIPGIRFANYLAMKKRPGEGSPQRQQDDTLALAIAKFVESQQKGLVPGNHLDDTPEVVHYAASADSPPGFSLGDWGPVTVGKPGDAGNRPGAPVITVEVFDNDESGAFAEDGQQLFNEEGKSIAPSEKKLDGKRSKQLQAYAQALMGKFLEPL